MTKNHYTTREVADRVGVERATVYQRLSDKGDFWGILPVRSFNGRLLWPIRDIDALADRHTVEPQLS